MLDIVLLMFAAAASSAPAQAQGGADLVGPHLAQVRSFAASEGEKVWSGYGTAPFGFLLVTDQQEILLCRDEVPPGFTPAGVDQATGCKRFTRPRTDLPDDLLAAFPLFDPPSVIVMGTPQSTGKSEAGWIRTILHEHFHQWQNALPGYYDRTRALDLAGEDKTGMWMLNFPFPYEDAAVGAAFNEASQRLADAIAARGTARFASSLASYLAARHALAARAGERNWRYFELQLWQEGVARWTDIRLGKSYPRQDVRDDALSQEQALLNDLRAPKLGESKRRVVYSYGAAEAMLLEACWPQWRDLYPQHLALGPLMETARKSCAARPAAGERG